MKLAQAYPNAHFVGYDVYGPSIEHARLLAQQAGVAERVRFQQLDASQGLPDWRTVWKAVSCHQTQLPAYHLLEHLPEEQHKALWGCKTYYRVFSLVNGGRTVEDDVFEGLRL